MKQIDNLKKLNIIFILTLPVLGFIAFLRSGNVERYYWSLLFFFVSYGLLFVLPDNGDAYRHYQHFLATKDIPFSQVLSQIKDVLSLQSESDSDIYVLLSNYFVSIFSSSISVLFGFHALIYSLIYLASLKLVLTGTNPNKNILTFILFLLIIFIASIAKIQYVRYYLAMWFFLYATIGFLKTRNRIHLFYGLISVLIHFSFVVPLILFFVYIFFKDRFLIWFVIGILAFTTNNFLGQYTSTILTYSNHYFEDSSLDEKSRAYVGNKEYIETRENRFDNRVWYANPSKYLNMAYTPLLFLVGLLFYFKRIELDKILLVLLTFSFFIFSLTEFGQAFASFGERMQQLYFIVFSMFLLHYFSQYSNRLFQGAAFLLSPFYLIFLALALRELFFTGDLFTFIGNPYFALFIERTSFLTYLMP